MSLCEVRKFHPALFNLIEKKNMDILKTDYRLLTV